MVKETEELLLKLRLHEESMLAQRLMIFLLFNSILFLGFVGLLNSDYLWLKRIVPFTGILSCILLGCNMWRVKNMLDWLDKELEEVDSLIGKKIEEETGIKKLSKLYIGRHIGFWVSGIFLLLVWLPSLLSVYGIIS